MAVEQGKHRHAHAADDVGADGSDSGHTTFAGKLLIGAIRVYQMTLSRQFPPSCRFYPSCSEYTAQSIAKYGAIKGAWLGTKRILRCHPFHPGGYDPVP